MSGFISTTTITVLGAVLLCQTAAIPTPANLNVHEQMTVDEIRQVFRTEPHEVPEYEVVSLPSPRRQERDYGGPINIGLVAFEKNVQLWLNPLDGILAGYDTPVYHAYVDHTLSGNVRFDKLKDPLSSVGRFLEDKNKQATLAVAQAGNGRRLVSGTIGSENWTIRPLPYRFNNQSFGRIRRSVNNDDYVGNATNAGYEELNNHVIYKNPGLPKDSKFSVLPADADFLANLSRSERSTVVVPPIVYPQIIVVADYATFHRHNEDTSVLLAYLIPFWNAVDMKYRGIVNPSIRLNIAGILIEAMPDALSYISTNKVRVNELDIYGTLKSSGVYRRHIEILFPLDNADIMVTMSSYDMCSPSQSGCETGTLGLANIGGACRNVDNTASSYTSSVAIVQDKGGFDGVFTAAHELGHLFGAGHDGDAGVGCSAASGHIMTPHPIISENVGTWSPCSLQAFDHFFKNHLSVCLFNPPQSNYPMPRVLPGRVKTLDEQCLAIGGTKSCHQDPRLSQSTLAQYADEVCLRLRCFDATSGFCNTLSSNPAEGSICGNGMICLDAKCVRQDLVV